MCMSVKGLSHAGGTQGKVVREEQELVLCLRLCSELAQGVEELVSHSGGLFSVAVALMSHSTGTRVAALHLLAATSGMARGRTSVLEAVSMLRLKFGEPVR